MDFKLLGQQIIDLRKFRNITQEALAKQANISQTYLSLIERGELPPDLDTLRSIADCLNVTLCEIFLFEEQKNIQAIKPLVSPLMKYANRKELDDDQINTLIERAKKLFGD